MFSTRDIKRKIRSISNTRQITRAMEMVAASKMRKSQQVALSSRAYCQKSLELLGNLSGRTDALLHPLLQKRKGNKTALLVVTSDKGLCGGFNANVFKKSMKFLAGQEGQVDIISVGKKSKEFFQNRSFEVAAEFKNIGDIVLLKETTPIADLLIDLYLKGKYDLIMASYTHFISTLKQEAVLRQILPISIESTKEIVENIVPERGRYSETAEKEQILSKQINFDYKIEPTSQEVLNELLPNLIRIAIYHIILESNASEHSSRMVAMRNASENAQKFIQELTLSLNKLRQAAITQELLEISSSSEALSG